MPRAKVLPSRNATTAGAMCACRLRIRVVLRRPPIGTHSDARTWRVYPSRSSPSLDVPSSAPATATAASASGVSLDSAVAAVASAGAAAVSAVEPASSPSRGRNPLLPSRMPCRSPREVRRRCRPGISTAWLPGPRPAAAPLGGVSARGRRCFDRTSRRPVPSGAGVGRFIARPLRSRRSRWSRHRPQRLASCPPRRLRLRHRRRGRSRSRCLRLRGRRGSSERCGRALR